MRSASEWLRRVGSNRVVAAIVVTVVTLAVIGVALISLTSVGCGAARHLGLGHVGNKCGAAQPVAGRSTSTPLSPTARPQSPNPPTSGPASDYPPYNPPASNYPPYNPPGSASPPFGGQGSAYPFNPMASAGGQYPGSPSCSLPIYAGPPGSGGFVTFPGGNFIADPKSSVTQPTPPGQTSPPPQQGYGQGYAGLTYDRKYSRWLPVQYRWVSPDGGRYAFLSGNSIYTVSVATGVLSELGEGGSWYIIDVQDEGVYAGVPNAAGLWLLPYSGSPKQLIATGFWQAVGAGAAFGTATSAVPQGATNTIMRFDLSMHATNEWFSETGNQSAVIGFDRSGHPIIQANGPLGQSIVITTGAYNYKVVILAGTPGGFNINGTPIADSNGIWFTGYWNGPMIALLTNSALYGMSTLGGQLAGGCS